MQRTRLKSKHHCTARIVQVGDLVIMANDDGDECENHKTMKRLLNSKIEIERTIHD